MRDEGVAFGKNLRNRASGFVASVFILLSEMGEEPLQLLRHRKRDTYNDVLAPPAEFRPATQISRSPATCPPLPEEQLGAS